MVPRFAALAAINAVIGLGACEAAEFVFPLPHLLGSPVGEQTFDVDLGGQFASISGARLQIAGSHAPGLLGDLNSPRTFAHPTSIEAYSRAELFPQSAILGKLLPTVAGSFAIDEPFHRIGSGGSPDFSSWLDGTANLYFSAGPSPYLAIYYEIESPMVAIGVATLTVTGERPAAAVRPAADFNGDGAVDQSDLDMWRSAYGPRTPIALPDADADGDADGDDFLAWQRQLTAGGATVGAAARVPEPRTLALVLAALVACQTWQRAGRGVSAV